MNEIKITSENFENEINNSNIPVLIDFYANWCGPCKMLSPLISEIASEYAGRLKVGKVNVDEKPEFSARFDVFSIPTLIIFKDGKAAFKSVGAMPKDDLVKFISQAL